MKTKRQYTMHEAYDEPLDRLGNHLCCEKCGCCITCGDCICEQEGEE